MIADKQSVFHRAGGNDTSLTYRSVDEHEGQGYPEPGDDFALDALAHWKARFFFARGFFVFGVNFHVPAPQFIAPPAFTRCSYVRGFLVARCPYDGPHCNPEAWLRLFELPDKCEQL